MSRGAVRQSAEPNGAATPLANSAALAPAPASPARPPSVEIELPYPLDARPRAVDPIQAAVDDEQLARWNAGGSSDLAAATGQASFHPGTRVTVDTRPAKRRPGAPRLAPPRGLTFDRVQAQTRSHGYWPFRLCFEAGQRERKGSGGETRVAFTIGLRGTVRAVRLLDSELGNSKSTACLLHALSKLEFTPAPAQALHLVASIRIYPGDLELPEVDAPSAAAALPAGEFDAEAARAVIASKQSDLEACLVSAQQRDAALWGRLSSQVILEVDGSVHRVLELESHFPNPAAARCAQAVLAGLQFPSVNGKPFSFVVGLRLHPAAATDVPPPAAPAEMKTAEPGIAPSSAVTTPSVSD